MRAGARTVVSVPLYTERCYDESNLVFGALAGGRLAGVGGAAHTADGMGVRAGGSGHDRRRPVGLLDGDVYKRQVQELRKHVSLKFNVRLRALTGTSFQAHRRRPRRAAQGPLR